MSTRIIGGSPPLFTEVKNVTSSRVSGTEYTNTSNKPIMVLAKSYRADAPHTVTGRVNGTDLAEMSQAAGLWADICFIVPPGEVYKVTASYLSLYVEIE